MSTIEEWMTKARFRAIRESIGLSLRDVAQLCGVQERTARRWEAPGYNDPPEDAWDALAMMERRYQDGVSGAIDAVKQSGAKIVSISYYRSQEEYDAFGRDEGPVGFANAISREVMLWLEGRGYDVRMCFPEDADDTLTSAIMLTRD